MQINDSFIQYQMAIYLNPAWLFTLKPMQFYVTLTLPKIRIVTYYYRLIQYKIWA